jgi:hypothetical protein
LDRARRATYVELYLGFVLAAVTVFAIVAPPACLCPMVAGTPLGVERFLIPGAGLVGVIVGLVSMLRLSRPRVEAGKRDWRYRARRD